MKIGEYERFNDHCGLAYIFNKETNENWYIVYGSTSDPESDYPYAGQVVSIGKSREEALINSVKYFIAREKRFEDAMADERGHLEKLYKYISEIMFTNSREVILPIQDCDMPKGEFFNVDVFIRKDKAYESIQ